MGFRLDLKEKKCNFLSFGCKMHTSGFHGWTASYQVFFFLQFLVFKHNQTRLMTGFQLNRSDRPIRFLKPGFLHLFWSTQQSYTVIPHHLGITVYFLDLFLITFQNIQIIVIWRKKFPFCYCKLLLDPTDPFHFNTVSLSLSLWGIELSLFSHKIWLQLLAFLTVFNWVRFCFVLSCHFSFIFFQNYRFGDMGLCYLRKICLYACSLNQSQWPSWNFENFVRFDRIYC